jgi:hypothetical protein
MAFIITLLFSSVALMTSVKIDEFSPLTHVFSRVVPTTFVGGLFPLIGVL